jgi:hypothetical protein
MAQGMAAPCLAPILEGSEAYSALSPPFNFSSRPGSEARGVGGPSLRGEMLGRTHPCT